MITSCLTHLTISCAWEPNGSGRVRCHKKLAPTNNVLKKITIKMEHQTLDKTMSTSPMLPKEGGDDKMVIITPNNGVGKILIREDTILANLHGCAGCGKSQFTCGGVKNQWSVLCWGKQSEKKYYCCKYAFFFLVLFCTFYRRACMKKIMTVK